MTEQTFRVWRGDSAGGDFKTYKAQIGEGMVVLDVLHQIQAKQANDLAIRWNCKAGKCGSCSMEINGRPRLSCMTRMNIYAPDETTEGPETYISSQQFAEVTEARARHWGDSIGARYGEPFIFQRPPHREHAFVKMLNSSE